MPRMTRWSRMALRGQTLSRSRAAGGLFVEDFGAVFAGFDEDDAAGRAAVFDQPGGELAVLVVDERIVEEEGAVGDDEDLAFAPDRVPLVFCYARDKWIVAAAKQRVEFEHVLVIGRLRTASRFGEAAFESDVGGLGVYSLGPGSSEFVDAARFGVADKREPAGVFLGGELGPIGGGGGAGLGLAAERFVGLILRHELLRQVGNDAAPVVNGGVVVAADIDDGAILGRFREPFFEKGALFGGRRCEIAGEPDDDIGRFELGGETAESRDAMAGPFEEIGKDGGAVDAAGVVGAAAAAIGREELFVAAAGEDGAGDDEDDGDEDAGQWEGERLRLVRGGGRC
jgi:hypothetical protein